MTEKLLHYLWQFQYFEKSDLRTASGEEIAIIFPGTLNTNQGPDFSNARIKIGSTILMGSVELHINATDWHKHGHQWDGNYKNVILHVVFNNDDTGDKKFPVLELKDRIPKLLLEKYAGFMQGAPFIPCAANIAGVKDIVWLGWKERLVAERLTRKAAAIFQILKQTNEHWEETFWRLLARNFGTKVNGAAFENIAQSISINTLARQKNSILQIESLLLGQAQLLTPDLTDDYPKLLLREYHFLKAKYSLQASHIPVLFLRMRPYNFPTIRLAQLAALVCKSTHLFSKIIDTENSTQVKELLSATASDYWHTHFRFDEATPYIEKKIGADMIDNIIINTVVPVLFAYGIYKNEEHYKLRAINWLEALKGEKNTIVDGFVKASIINKNAFDSQALIELKNEYCNHKRCLECSVGTHLLKGATNSNL